MYNSLIDKEKWDEIYDKARENGYGVFNFLVETMKISLAYPGYIPTDTQIVLKLHLLSEDEVYSLCMNPNVWPKVG